MNLSLEEETRYSRQMRLEELGTEGQLRLKASKIVVIGAGGLGCPVLSYLVAAGIGKIRIVDNDVVSLSNLQRQVLYCSDDVGKSKAGLLRDKLQSLNPNVQIEAIAQRLNSSNAKSLLKDFDVVVDGSDNFATRYIVNDVCNKLGLPLVAAAIFRFEGQLAVYNYQGSPDYRSLFPTPPKSSERPNCAEIGVIGVLPGILGSLQANEVIKICLKLPDVLAGKLFIIDALTLKTKILDFNKLTVCEKGMEIRNGQCRSSTIEDQSIQLVDYNTYRSSTEYFLVDVRSYEEHQNYNIGGLCVPVKELEQRVKELPVNKKLLLYCKSGVRSQKASRLLATHISKDNLFELQGGIEAVPASNWILSTENLNYG